MWSDLSRSLSGNMIGNDGAGALANALKRNTTVKQIEYVAPL